MAIDPTGATLQQLAEEFRDEGIDQVSLHKLFEEYFRWDSQRRSTLRASDGHPYEYLGWPMGKGKGVV